MKVVLFDAKGRWLKQYGDGEKCTERLIFERVIPSIGDTLQVGETTYVCTGLLGLHTALYREEEIP